MNSANEALATFFCADAPNFNHKVDFIHTVISQPQVSQFIQNLNLKTNDNALLVESLCHTSFVNEVKAFSLNSNERLELLGDSVVNLIITSEIYKLYPQLPEGELSKLRGSLVNESRLQQLAQFIGLSQVILTGKGETRKQGYEGAAIMSDAFEALVGAVYLDQGFEYVNSLLSAVFTRWKEEKGESFFDIKNLHVFDAKTRLQELTMAHYKELPVYLSEETENGFLVKCCLKGQELAQVERVSKKKAQIELAQIVLEKHLYKLDQSQES